PSPAVGSWHCQDSWRYLGVAENYITGEVDRVLEQNPNLVTQPGVAVPLALGRADGTQVGAVSGFVHGRKMKAYLESLPDAEELKVWASLSSADQSLVRGVGYVAQAERKQSEKRSLWGEIGRVL